ncbi:MAG: retropepsin-like aspartic protease [Phycisphaeraceae bacterium]
MRDHQRLLLAACAICIGVAAPRLQADTPSPLDPARDGLTLNLGFNDLALGQPVVAVEVFNGATPLGPVVSQPWLLDTGATGVFAAGGTFYNFGSLDLFELLDVLDGGDASGLLTNAATELTNSGLTYAGAVGELGVGGVEVVKVSNPYSVNVSYGGAVQNSLSGVKLLVNPDADFGEFAGIVGMPAMVNKVTTLDMSGWSGGLSISAPGEINLDNLDDWLDSILGGGPDPGSSYADSTSIGVTIGSSLPAVGHPSQRLSVPLHYKTYEYDPADIAGTAETFSEPTAAPLSFVDATLENGDSGLVFTDMLIDTGAQISIINSALAIALGLDRNGDLVVDELDLNALDPNEQILTVSGVSGSVDAPTMKVDSLRLLTDQGVTLEWTAYLLVLDIHETIPAIFGSDLFTSGWSDVLLASLFPELVEGPVDDGNFLAVHFDYRNYSTQPGRMYFDLTQPVPEPGSVAVLLAMGALMLSRRRGHA